MNDFGVLRSKIQQFFIANGFDKEEKKSAVLPDS